MSSNSHPAGARVPAVAKSAAGASAVPSVVQVALPDDILPLRLKTVASLTQVSEKTVRRWIQAGALRSHKLGGARVVRKCDLRAFLDAQAGETNKEAA